MTSIDDVYQTIQFIVRKNSTGGAIDPDQFNLIVNRAQFSKFMKSYGNEQEYVPGKPIPRQSFEETQSVTDELSPFIENLDQILDSNGRFLYPENYIHTIPGMYLISAVNNPDGKTFTKKIIPIEVVDKQYESYRLSSSVVIPTTSYPIAIEESNYTQIYPVMQGPVVKWSYLREPAQALWAFFPLNDPNVTDAQGNMYTRPVYDPVNSVDLEWRSVDINSIISLAVSYIGISIKDVQVSAYAELTEKEGI